MKAIILTGPKHSGKTSTGKALASLCSCSFIDLDELIHQRTGKTPRQLYTESDNSDGSLFKQAEAEAVTYMMTTLASDSAAPAGRIIPVCAKNFSARNIIAAGGGIIDNPEAMAALKKSDVIMVYLNISADKAWKRIASSENGKKPKSELPPFLQTDNPQETHRLLHERRAAAYSQIADIVIETENKTPEEIARMIQASLEALDTD